LQGAGYRVFSLGWSMRGVIVRPLDEAPLAKAYEAPNFIASIHPDEVIDRCSPRGWRVLTPRLAEKSSR
jgi:hypothetical protein